MYHAPRLVDSHKGKQYVDLEKSCLAFNDDMADRLRILQDSVKSKLCAILHNDNLQKAGVKGLQSVTTDKASDAMVFARKLRQVRSKLDTKLLFGKVVGNIILNVSWWLLLNLVLGSWIQIFSKVASVVRFDTFCNMPVSWASYMV